MKLSGFAFFASFVVVSAFGNRSESFPKLMTEIDARVIVEQQESANEARYEALRQEFAGSEVLKSRTDGLGEGILTINRIKPILIEKPESRETVTPIEPRNTQEELEAMLASRDHLVREQISLGANVYEDAYSEITWRDADTGRAFIVWTNMSLNHFRPVTEIQHGSYAYAYFGFVTAYTKAEEMVRLESARKMGVEVESRWKEPPVRFSGDRFDYVVLAEEPSEVPEKLYRQMDALLDYYKTHRESLVIEWQNRQTLAAAREAYFKENPPVKRPTQVNYWKIEDPVAGQ